MLIMDDDRSMQDLKATVWIGKSGCTDSMIEEIKSQLRNRTRVKVKWLHNTTIDPEAIAYRTGADLVGVRGRTLVLVQRKKTGRLS
jgi:RNA-binding protein